MSAQQVLDAVAEQRLVAIVRTSDAERAISTGRALLAAGVRCVEVSLVTPDGLDAVRVLARERPEGTFVGAGTVLEESEVDATADAGGTFVVSPVLDVGVVRRTVARGLASFPGVATPSEALVAVRAGASAVKVFPASAWGPGVLRDVRAALPWLRTVPTGGIGAAEAAEWVRAGAFAVGLGSSLGALAERAPEQVVELLAELRRAADPGPR